jgi:hypothetical protein
LTVEERLASENRQDASRVLRLEEVAPARLAQGARKDRRIGWAWTVAAVAVLVAPLTAAATDHDASGAVTDTCDAGSVSWKAKQ